jgi:hypothetical protein
MSRHFFLTVLENSNGSLSSKRAFSLTEMILNEDLEKEDNRAFRKRNLQK